MTRLCKISHTCWSSCAVLFCVFLTVWSVQPSTWKQLTVTQWTMCFYTKHFIFIHTLLQPIGTNLSNRFTVKWRGLTVEERGRLYLVLPAIKDWKISFNGSFYCCWFSPGLGCVSASSATSMPRYVDEWLDIYHAGTRFCMMIHFDILLKLASANINQVIYFDGYTSLKY